MEKDIIIRKSLMLTLLLMGCLQSCIYETNFMSEVDIKKPNTYAPMDITLSSTTDSIIIFDKTDFDFNINTYKLKFNVAVLKYLNVERTFEQSSGGFTLDPGNANENWFDLTIDFYVCTGSGSIADKLNAENYLGSRTWKIKYLDLKTYNYHFQNRISADSLVEVFWIKPKAAPSTIGAVYKGNSTKLTATRISGDTLFYTDPSYCGGDQNYDLNVSVNSKEQIGFGTHVNYPFPEFNIVPIGLDSCLVSWTTSPIKRYYKLSNKYKGFGNSYKDIALPGVSMDYNLSTFPFNNPTSTSYSSYIWTTYVKGIKADYRWAYSNLKDKFVLSKGNISPALEWCDYTLPAYDNRANGANWEYILCGNNAGTHYAGIIYGILHVFDENLVDIKQITMGTRPETDSYYYLQVTDNGCFTYLNDSREFTILNLGSDTSWQKFTFKPNYIDSTTTSWAMGMTSLTADGRYAAVCGERNLYIYDVSDHKNATVVFSTPRSQAYSVLANRLNKDELIVSTKDKIEVRTCPDFQLKKQLIIEGMGNFEIMNVDSYSNILLVSSSTYYHFINLETMKEVFRLTLGGNPYYGYGARLYRKQFFMGNTKTDMTPYLK